MKVWADTMLTFFVTLTVLLVLIGREKDSVLISFISGVVCGIGVLVKQTAGFLVIAIGVFHIWQHRRNVLKMEKIPKIIFDKHLIALAIGLIVTTAHWFYLASVTYGNPLYSPQYTDLSQKAAWFALLDSRPRFLYLGSIPYHVPLFLLAYFTIFCGPFLKNFIDDKRAFLITWTLTFFGILFYMGTKENRYMLPAYPAIAMLSADVLNRVRCFLNGKLKLHLGDILVVAVLIGCAFWSVPIGLKHALVNTALIRVPF